MGEAILINEIPTSKKVVAITFDDGPNPIYTPQVLEIFNAAEGKATFFMIGDQIKKNPVLAKKVSEEGHEIGNHTLSHPKLSELTAEDCLYEIEEFDRIIADVTGKKPLVFRPPYMDYNEETEAILKEKGYPMIGAVNFEAQDWEQPGADHIFSKSLESVKDGSILIFHDGYGDRSQTIEAVRMLVQELRSQNYELVTVSELLKRQS